MLPAAGTSGDSWQSGRAHLSGAVIQLPNDLRLAIQNLDQSVPEKLINPCLHQTLIIWGKLKNECIHSLRLNNGFSSTVMMMG
jgi:hypothetical protein